MKLSEEYNKIKDSYVKIVNHMKFIVVQFCNIDTPMYITHFEELRPVPLAGEDKICIHYVKHDIDGYGDVEDICETYAIVPSEWLDMSREEVCEAVLKYREAERIRMQKIREEADEARDRREYDRLKKKYEG
jgi:hypothetical protein